jgi:hypothetical protein
MDLVVQGLIAENFIEPSFELVETFKGYWNAIMPLGTLWNLGDAINIIAD